MNLQQLFTMQAALDQHIEAQHNLQNEDLLDRKVLALLVELGELANETRCFKFWSLKPSSPKEIILEEFVDGVHFILSLGIICGFTDSKIESRATDSNTLSDQFLTMYDQIGLFRQQRNQESYVSMFECYLQLAIQLGFSSQEIEQAYVKKNEINYERQRQGY